MSAFVVGTKHIDYLVQAALLYNRGPVGSNIEWAGKRVRSGILNEVGAGLLAENIKSVAYRYGSTENLPGPVPLPTPDTYQLRPVAHIDPVQVIKAIHCYEYQSCEHDRWAGSPAWKFCRELLAATTRRLPGYDDAEWEIR